jgi:hypothetical protein
LGAGAAFAAVALVAIVLTPFQEDSRGRGGGLL